MKYLIALAAAALSFGSLPAEAQSTYPSRPITMIVPNAAGSGTDTIARILTSAMGEYLNGVAFVLDNKPGANSIIAATSAAKSTPDGYTLFLTTNTSHSVNPYIYKQLPYDPNDDFVPIGLIGETGPALLTAKNNPANTIKDVIELSRKGNMNFASSNTSSLAATQLLGKQMGVKLVIAKYKASPLALTDTMAGTINYYFGDLASGGPLVHAGNLKVLAVLSDKRLPGFPDVPTMTELGYTGFEIPVWIGLFAPKGTPQDVIERVNRALAQAQGKKEVIDALTAASINVRTTTPAAFATYVHDQYLLWGRIAKEIDLQAD